MPVTYSFTTPLVLPVGPEFTCADIDASSMLMLLSLPEVSTSRGAPWIDVIVGNDLLISSDDGVASTFRLDLLIQQQFTVEFTFRPSKLPYDLSNLSQHHLFIGAFNEQDNAAGLLISKMGLAIVAAYGNAVLPIPGSHTLFSEGEDYYTLRMVVDGVADKMDLYITKTSDLSTIGHQLRYTMPAPTSPTGSIDSIYIDVVGTPGVETITKFAAIRANCSECLTPNQRPIADPGPDQTSNLGNAIRYDGSASYDPEGMALSYRWYLVSAPDSSRFVTKGSGNPYDDGGPDPYTTIFDGGSGAFSKTGSPLLQPGDYLFFNAVYYEISTVGWVYNSTTHKYDRDPLSGWVDNQVRLTTDSLPKSDPAGNFNIFHTKAYFSDSAYVMPSAVPDVSGIYEVELIVNDGTLDSLPTDALLNMSTVRLALGCTPDLSWVWGYISDFWSLVDGHEAVETIWSGFAQAAAAELLTAFQIDYNKSLIDIQRFFQRRWLDYDTLLIDTAPEDASIRIIRGPLYSGDLAALTPSSLNNKILQLVLDAGAVQEVKFGWVMNSGGALVSDPISTLSDAVRQINYWMGYATASTPLAVLKLSGPHKYIALDYTTLLLVRPNSSVDSANTLLGFSTTDYEQNDLEGDGKPFPGGDITRPELYYGWKPTIPYGMDFILAGVERNDLLVVDDVGFTIQKVATGDVLSLKEQLPLDDTEQYWIVPSTVTSTTLDFDSELVVAGDIARFEVKTDSSGLTAEIYCEVLGVRGYILGFDPRPLLEKFAGVPSKYTTAFLGVKHTKNIPVHEYVKDIPRLQEIIKEPTTYLTQNLDFVVELVGSTNAIVFTDGLYSISDPPPNTLWAEVTYLDNRPTIEANFGHLVNFKVEDLATRTDDLDYLSAVQVLWWAYFGGPAIYRVRAGVQILLGLPFAEVTGTITSIETQFGATQGRILIQDEADPTVTRSYYYPLAAGLGTFPNGNTIKVGDSVPAYTPLSGGVEVKDWLGDQTWYRTLVDTGNFLELEKFFKFMVRADVDTFNVTNILFAVDFVKRIKPHYTYPVFILLKNLPTTEVDVADTMKFVIKLRFWECKDPYQYGAYRFDDVRGDGTWRHRWDALTYDGKFAFDRNRLTPVVSCWALIGMDMDGLSFWPFDSIWALDDGGGADRVPLSGPDSSLPPPYGPPLGPVKFDVKPAAGHYSRAKNL